MRFAVRQSNDALIYLINNGGFTDYLTLHMFAFQVENYLCMNDRSRDIQPIFTFVFFFYQ